MHIPDGFLDSKTAVGMGAAAATVVGLALSKVRALVTELGLAPAMAGAGNGIKSLNGKARRFVGATGKSYLSRMAMVTSLVFATQMFNFPISQGTSGHLLGGLFAALFLGPWGGALSITMVLLVQATLYADGGLVVMGANIMNMAFFGCIVSYFGYVLLKTTGLTKKICLSIAAWASVVLASSACALELGMSGTYSIVDALSAMLSVHAFIGIGEMLITLMLVSIMKNMLGWEEYRHE